MEGALKLLKILEWRQIKGVIGFFFRHPFLFTSAIPATWECVAICDQLFGKTHHKNNKANAFRHALWNMMLTRNALRFERDPDKALGWAKIITDWHEDFSPNDPLARSMDLHNNDTGRRLYRLKFADKRANNTQLTQALVPLLEKAVKIEHPNQVRDHHSRLVFIKD